MPDPPVVLDRPWVRGALVALAGAGVTVAVQWVGQATAPTEQVRAVISESSTELREGRGEKTRDHTVVAVTEAGREIDLAGSGNGAGLTRHAAGLHRGVPVVVTRSAFDGEVLSVRSPLATVPVAVAPNVVGLRVGVLVVAVAALGFGVWGWSRATVGIPVLCAVAGILLTAVLIRPGTDGGPPRYPLSDAMAGYADPPTGPSPDPLLTSRSVDAVVPTGTAVATTRGVSLTVTGPPRRGGRADGFTTVSVPLAVDGGGSTPPMRLIGTGTGTTVELPACPDGGTACFVVPDDLVPRYLVLLNQDVAIALDQPG
ncbi:hypothetical protein [Pseudonocardia oceani]|uniref:Uncharacterized protein n=4 Tax=Pseudonocardia oceani TaxID=2792013 RepID=A0ABS6UJJ0_9PSEU|nr:hypothetical protein [Pseudonocardia oceani]MBW0111107.1 hypothetical protein [Pseudonocardia oceani]MBW0122099.1 hypothetical protein [Pseudonocardia oceani]MBW0131999.1 hypothetical protein [Pseudonocardia oceani]